MISFRHRGDLSKTTRYFQKLNRLERLEYTILERYGQRGVDALAAATPVDSGETANSWFYEIVRGRNSISIQYKNSNINNGVPIAIILQYGHGTNHGGYVQGRDYINPAAQPIFDIIAEEAWKEVDNL